MVLNYGHACLSCLRYALMLALCQEKSSFYAYFHLKSWCLMHEGNLMSTKELSSSTLYIKINRRPQRLQPVILYSLFSRYLSRNIKISHNTGVIWIGWKPAFDVLEISSVRNFFPKSLNDYQTGGTRRQFIPHIYPGWGIYSLVPIPCEIWLS